MVSNEIKKIIDLAIVELENEDIVQSVIDRSVKYLKSVIIKIKEEKITIPVTQEELLSKFPTEPIYPELQLQKADIEVDLKEDLLSLEASEGTIVKTKGYYNINDGGQACYEIMSYDKWYNELPIELKLVTYHNDRIGCNAVYYKNPADDFGNHKLDNGMVAKLLPNLDGYVRVEQWGCFEGRMDNSRSLVHCFSNNRKNSKILFRKNSKYILYYDTQTEKINKIDKIIKSIPWWLSKENCCKSNEYALIHHSRWTLAPCLGDAQNVELCGNNCCIKIGDGQSKENFAMFEIGGYVDGFKMHGFNLDGNFKEQIYQLSPDGTYPVDINGNTKYTAVHTKGHGISYFTSGVGAFEKDTNGYIKDGNGNIFGEGITEETIKNYDNFKNYGSPTLNNVDIYGNNFVDFGTGLDQSDSGGDFILIINPTISNNVNIHNNKFTNWGRWVFAVDLGGNGERFYNYKFKQNICIQNENNYNGVKDSNNNPTGYRGLGFIDFEARKCFTNLEVSENYVYGANGWAFNGNGKISENIIIERNHLERPNYNWKSIYPYSFNFYSVFPKALVFNSNHIKTGSCGLGIIYNLKMKNNNFDGTGTLRLNLTGECDIENNEGEGTRGTLFSLSSSYNSWLNDINSEFYIPNKQRETKIFFKNNIGGGVTGTLINTDNPEYYKNTSIIFENNVFNKFGVNAYGLKEFIFDDSQLAKQSNGLPIVYVARGLTASKPSFCYGFSMVVGGLHFEKGQKILNSYEGMGRNTIRYFTTDLKYSEYYQKGYLDCIESGYIPIYGVFLLCNTDNYWSANSTCGKDTLYIYNDNVYYCDKDGTFGEMPPTHTYGTVENGDSRLMFFDKLAKIEIKGLEDKYLDNTCFSMVKNTLEEAKGYYTKIMFDEVKSNFEYKLTAIEEVTEIRIGYYNSKDELISCVKAQGNVMDFTTPNECTQIRVCFKTLDPVKSFGNYIFIEI